MSGKQVVKDYVKDPMFEKNTLLPIKWGDEWLMLDDVVAFMNMLTDENRQLKKENEKLRKELGDCEKFRYTVFKRLNDEYIKERSIK